MTDETDQEQRIARMRALRDNQDPASVDELVQLCAPENDDAVRDNAADHLWMKVAGGVPRFSASAPSPLQTELRKNIGELRRLLHDELPSVRRSGIQILTELPDADATARFRVLARSDPDQEVRELAGKALERLDAGTSASLK